MAAATVVVVRVAVTARVVVWPAAERAEARVAVARVLPALLIVQIGALDHDVDVAQAAADGRRRAGGGDDLHVVDREHAVAFGLGLGFGFACGLGLRLGLGLGFALGLESTRSPWSSPAASAIPLRCSRETSAPGEGQAQSQGNYQGQG